MFYQKILMDEQPYQVIVEKICEFGEHRHADIEFNYCIKGSFDIKIDKKQYRINEGELSLISPMMSHEIPTSEDNDRLVLTVIVGPSLLKGNFSLFSKAEFSTPVFSLHEPTEKNEKLRALLHEVVELCHDDAAYSDLMITGNLYKILAILLEELAEPASEEKTEKKDLRMVANIEKALELIYHDYAKPLTVTDAALATGYGKSNFCKIFKHIVGDSFHSVLNRQRVRNAYGLLTETNMSITEIAQEVGFSETKTFCRVFKHVSGVTPGTYRKNRNIKKGM